ncbi:MAG: hypothetical protein AABZ53_12410, partial [Planctomycetota bacterium]
MGIGDMLGWIGRAVGPAATVSLVASRKPMWQSATETCLRVVGWLAAAGLVVAVGYGWTHSGEAAARLLLWSLGLLTAGMFIGFLFGLPRVTPGSDAPAPAGRGSGGGAGSVAGEVGGAAGVAGAVENVEGAPLRDPVVLCGTMFPPLRVIRHRLFETNFPITAPPHGNH